MDGIKVYGVFYTDEELAKRAEDERLGIVRYHPTTYLEWNIPKELESYLDEVIEQAISAFEKTCQCEDCKQKRQSL